MTAPQDSDSRLPVTLLAGFLGSGKTTLANRILSEDHGQRIAVIVNEFGDVGIDGRLVVGGKDEIVELVNGCICCTVRGDLRETLADLIQGRERRFFGKLHFDRVLIEASGLASPGPAVQTLLVDPELERALRLDAVVTVTHAGHIVRQIEEHPEAAEQVAYADRVLLNHSDQASATDTAAAEERLHECNPEAEVLRCVRADVPILDLLRPATAPVGVRLAESAATGAAEEHAHAGHTGGVGSVALRTTEPLALDRLKMWLQFLGQRKGLELMRMKGILNCRGHRNEVVVQAVYQWLELGPGAHAAPLESVLVLIGRGLDRAELERGWAACRD